MPTMLRGRTDVTDIQPGFDGGLNTSAQHIEVAPNELRQAANVRLTTYGAAIKRGGTQRTHAAALAAQPVTGGYAWRQPASTTEIVCCNGRLFSGTFGIPITWTNVGALPGNYPSFAAFRDGTGECVYIAMGDTPGLYKFKAGSITAVGGGSANVTRVCVQNQRLFGITGVDQTLYYSALNNGDSLGDNSVSDAGSQIIRTFSNQELRALTALGSSLIVFHRTGISRFTGYSADDITIASGTRGLSADLGTIAPDSVVTVENVAYFLSDRGIYLVRDHGMASTWQAEGEALEPISAKIETTIQGFGAMTWARVKTVHNRPFREVWFYFPGTEHCYVYNYRVKAWSGPHATGGSNIYALWDTITSAGAPVVLSGHLDGFVRQWDGAANFKDDVLSNGTGGAGYSLVAQCHRMYSGAPEHEKAYRTIEVNADLAGSTGASVGWSTITGSGSNNMTALTAEHSQQIQCGERGTSLDVTITDAGTTGSQFSRVTLQGFDYGRRY